MPKEVKMFACIHCGKKLLKTGKGMIAHEYVCFHNPENKYPCATCTHKTLKPLDDDSFANTISVHYCSKLKKQTHNLRFIKKGSFDGAQGFEESVLIQECEDFELK